jgi:hypothetical protein
MLPIEQANGKENRSHDNGRRDDPNNEAVAFGGHEGGG